LCAPLLLEEGPNTGENLVQTGGHHGYAFGSNGVVR
jgi:hypothetical protein